MISVISVVNCLAGEQDGFVHVLFGTIQDQKSYNVEAINMRWIFTGGDSMIETSKLQECP